MIFGFTTQQARAVLDTARHIEAGQTSLLHLAADWLAIGLRFVPLAQRRTVALAVSELALRKASALDDQPANSNGATIQ